MPLDLLDLDDAARRAALTQTGTCMLLRAGAGSGKTSVLAGRVVSLLAGGADPAFIAAISYTILSASELLERVTRFIDAVLVDRIPPDLAPAFPDGKADAEQKKRLLTARDSLDLVTCTTIHGFCAALLRPYPVEANFDPGAKPMGEAEGTLLFDEVFDTWLYDRLQTAGKGDLLLALFLVRPDRVREDLKKIGKELLARPDLAAQECTALGEPSASFAAAVAEFRAFVDGCGPGLCPERVIEVVKALEAQILEVPPGEDEAAIVTWLMGLAPPDCCATKAGEFNAASKVSSQAMWKVMLGGGKAMAEQVKLSNETAAALYTACVETHGAMVHAAAPRVLHLFCVEAHVMLAAYTKRKREAALLDFDDLVQSSRALLRARPDVRSDLNQRFRHLLVDEFQDTDPAQVEILWLLCGDPPEGNPDAPWAEWRLRPGALFLVGDPKQAIYRFRGADLASYQKALGLLQADRRVSVLDISRNFRSRGGILDWVNNLFALVFNRPEQAQHGALLTTVQDVLTTPAVVALSLAVEPYKHTKDGDPVYAADDVRDGEAEAVALLCARLVGHQEIRDRTAPGGVRLCEPRDIALLTPSGTDLWRYERALEDRGLTVAAQAGKGFFRRQEIQDLIALARVLADRTDTLALGALLRGPLVGATDEELLDAVAAQPRREDGSMQSLSLSMDPSLVPSPVLTEVLPLLSMLARHRRDATPHALMSRAVELLRVRATLRQRSGHTAERALANVDLFLEQAKPYALRGLKAFAVHMAQQWKDAEKAVDGRPDADRHSVTLMTMHGSKGLEWPVVIAVNQHTAVTDRAAIARDAKGHLHMNVAGFQSPECAEAQVLEKLQREYERERLWYVATTRARDLLVLPKLEGSKGTTWISLIPAHREPLPPHGADHEPLEVERPPSGENLQDEAAFNEEAKAVVASIPNITRLAPHLAEAGEVQTQVIVLPEFEGSLESSVPVQGSLVRGMVLHKLIEERLTGELVSQGDAVERRAAELIDELGANGPMKPDPKELSESVSRALGVPAVAAILNKLRPEWPVAITDAVEGSETIIVGYADAVALEDDGSISTVVDWKSDVEPTPRVVSHYRGQLATYKSALNARRGLLVFLTSGIVETI
jgi:ATP-dependent exoDNAse (exonuclease V) beta subunit